VTGQAAPKLTTWYEARPQHTAQRWGQFWDELRGLGSGRRLAGNGDGFDIVDGDTVVGRVDVYTLTVTVFDRS
jgi:hypothetical protein